MTTRTATTPQAKSLRPAASLAEWAKVINGLTAQPSSRKGTTTPANRSGAGSIEADRLLLTDVGNRVHDHAQHTSFDGEAPGYRMAPEVAENLVMNGLGPDFLGHLAVFSGLESRDLLDFAGIDRTTVSRRKASGSALPQDAAVKALQVTDLMTQAIETFGSPAQASAWLTQPHPLLNEETPLKRARTPWGMSKVQSLLVALRYGSAA
jgi:putative toxin-antitoxin system antitoxin component (TIGR02293 family)